MSSINKVVLNQIIEQSHSGALPANIEANLYASGTAIEKGDQVAASIQVAQAFDDLVALSARVSVPSWISPVLGFASVAQSIRRDVESPDIEVISNATALSASSVLLSVISTAQFTTAIAAGAALSSPVLIGAALVGIAAAGLTVLATSDWAGSEDFVGLDTLVTGLGSLGITLSDYITSVDEVILSEDSLDYEGNSLRQEVLGDAQDNIILAKGGDDFLIGGGGNDELVGGEGSDFLYGDEGQDRLTGGPGVDYLEGGSGADQFIWNTGDSEDVIGDYDDGGDRIIVDGIDLATLQFKRLSEDSPFYIDATNPGIRLRYEGDFLTIHAGEGQGEGVVTVTQYSPQSGQDYGIALLDYDRATPQAADVDVLVLGPGEGQTDSSAYWRQTSFQGEIDWTLSTIRFDANNVPNYDEGTLHGTLGGAFEGGALADELTGTAGSNALHGLGGDDLIYGEGGDDFLEGGAGSDVVQGGEGDDIVFGASRAGLADTLDPNSAQDAFYLAQGLDDSADTNILSGNAGSDILSGGGYRDFIDGGTGADRLFGGAGEDSISGGLESDVLYGDSALNYRYIDLAEGAVGELLEIAFADGQGGNGQYDDELFGGAGDDILWGELGNDVLYGQEGNDNLLGDRVHNTDYFDAELPAYATTTPELSQLMHGDDRLYGGGGSDLLMGHGGDDLLSGGRGSDSLLGGAGDDVYSIQPGEGLDYIDDAEGLHTLLFLQTSPLDIQVRFQGEQVFVGTGLGSEGFLIAASEWPRVNIALDSSSSVLERSVFETLYLDESGVPLITVPATATMSEAERAEIFTIDNSDPGRPRIISGVGVDAVEVEALAGGLDGAIIRLSTGLLSHSLQVAPGLVQGGLDFLESGEGVVIGLTGFAGDIFGTDTSDHIVGSGAADWINAGGNDDLIEARGGDDELYGGWGDDLIFGETGDDHLDGGAGSDRLVGGVGRDYLYGGQGTDIDILDGGAGDDVLEGGYGPDRYLFTPGDGHDLWSDPSGYHYLEFTGEIAPEDIALYFTGDDDSEFRFEYGDDDFVSNGVTSSHWIHGISLNGIALPLVQRSDLEDGSFYDSRSDDVFETGGGQDTVFVSGWGHDVVRLFSGDGQDRVVAIGGGSPSLKGEIHFGADIDLSAVSFSFLNGDVFIDYGDNDQLTIDTDTVAAHPDNILSRFTVSAESDPQWIPEIRAVGYVGELHGSHGSDRLIGNANVETIVPGYGDDIIEAGAGPDRIVLNGVYISQADSGIGNKSITGGADNDIVHTPLYQGLDFHYGYGDGHDRIDYDWSYSTDHPYSFTVDYEADTFSFNPYGQDSLVFGSGIALDDLRFYRFTDALEILLLDGSGGVRVDNFFPAYDYFPEGQRPHVDELFGEGPAPSSLDQPALLAALPATPIARLQFADGDDRELLAVLDERLQTMPDHQGALVTGGTGSDELAGTEGDDVIYAFEGDDSIVDYGGSNFVNAGAGDDFIKLYAGNSVIHYGPGGGRDIVHLGSAANDLVLELAEGVEPNDVSVAYEPREWGQTPVLYLSPAGDSMELVAFRFDVETESLLYDSPDAAAISVRFFDGNVVSLADIPEPDGNNTGMVIEGTSGNDVLIGSPGNDSLTGGRGNDTMSGGAGDDTFLITGLDQGKDLIDGGAGYDQIIGAAGDDRITLKSLLPVDGVELIDGRGGVDVLSGTGGGNTFDLSATELRNIALIDGGRGNDKLTGSSGSDVIQGGVGNDTLVGGAGDDTFLVIGQGQGKDRIDGGEGFDVILGGPGDDEFVLKSMSPDNAIERVDGLAGTNRLVGTKGGNSLDFSSTELWSIAAIDGDAGNDVITGSGMDDVVIGGLGNDKLDGGEGSDSYLFAIGDGRDRINNHDSDAFSNDTLHMLDVDYQDLWFSRKGKHLLVDVVGVDDQVRINNWYLDADRQLDEIHAGDHVLYREQVDQLVQAMAVFDVPQGVGAIMPAVVLAQLEPTLAAVWLETT